MTRAFQNYLHNKALPLTQQSKMIGGTLHTAVDERGLIVDQHLLEDYRMAGVGSDGFGCGWIACYNALRLLGKPQSAARTLLELEPAFALGGKLGTRAVQLAPYFLKKGYAVRFSTTRRAAGRVAAQCPANILYYVRGDLHSAHYVTFAPTEQSKDGEPVFHWYNSLSAPALPRAPLRDATAPCVCAGGSTGDERTIAELLAPEHPALWVVMNLGIK